MRDENNVQEVDSFGKKILSKKCLMTHNLSFMQISKEWQRKLFLAVLVWGVIQLIFSLIASMGLWFEFVLETGLIT